MTRSVTVRMVGAAFYILLDIVLFVVVRLHGIFRFRKIAGFVHQRITIRFRMGARVRELDAVLIDAPAHPDGVMALRRIIIALAIAIRNVIPYQIRRDFTFDRRARSLRPLEAMTPFGRSHVIVAIDIALLQERLQTDLALVVL